MALYQLIITAYVEAPTVDKAIDTALQNIGRDDVTTVTADLREVAKDWQARTPYGDPHHTCKQLFDVSYHAHISVDDAAVMAYEHDPQKFPLNVDSKEAIRRACRNNTLAHFYTETGRLRLERPDFMRWLKQASSRRKK
jgi:hypothetical protein